MMSLLTEAISNSCVILCLSIQLGMFLEEASMYCLRYPEVQQVMIAQLRDEILLN